MHFLFNLFMVLEGFIFSCPNYLFFSEHIFILFDNIKHKKFCWPPALSCVLSHSLYFKIDQAGNKLNTTKDILIQKHWDSKKFERPKDGFAHVRKIPGIEEECWIIKIRQVLSRIGTFLYLQSVTLPSLQTFILRD